MAADGTLRWALCGPGGVLACEGDQAPPAAELCELVLAAGLVRFAEPALPPGVARQGEAALGFALEEGLLNAPEENHYRLAAGIVAVTARAPLAQALAGLSANGVAVARVVAEEQCLPKPPQDGWSVARLANGWGVRLASGRALCVPHQGEALWAELLDGMPPGQLLVCGDEPLPIALRHLPATRRDKVDWRSTPIDAAHDFANGRSRWRRRLAPVGRRLARQAVLALAVLAMFDLALLAGQLGWLRWQQGRLADRLVEDARRMGAGPQSADQALNAARRHVAAARARRGLAQDGDLLPMLAALQPLLPEGGGMRHLRYRSGVLTVESVALPDAVPSDWRRRLAAAGWSVALTAPGQLTLTFAPIGSEETRP